MRAVVLVALVACSGENNPCERLAGPVSAIEALVHAPLELRSGYASGGGRYQYVDRRGRAGGGVVTIELANGDHLAAWTARDQLTLGYAVGDAVLYLVGKEHVALFRTPNSTIKIVLDAELFTAAAARTYVAAVVLRAR